MVDGHLCRLLIHWQWVVIQGRPLTDTDHILVGFHLMKELLRSPSDCHRTEQKEKERSVFKTEWKRCVGIYLCTTWNSEPWAAKPKSHDINHEPWPIVFPIRMETMATMVKISIPMNRMAYRWIIYCQSEGAQSILLFLCISGSPYILAFFVGPF